MPSVSVIMNVRNGASTLREALNSVLAQSFHDWELIVWDDRSTDQSAQIIAEYKDPRIRYFLAQEETSLGKARDNAIRQATGAWLAFLDQDDIWLPRKLEMQMALADDTTGLIYGRTVRFYPSGLERDYDQTHEFTLLPEGDIFNQLFTDSCFIAMSSAGFRRAAVGAVQEVVCRYRMHGANTSRLAALKMNQEVLWLIDQWADHLEPRTVALCRQRHCTAIALEEMRRPDTAARGMARLFTQGSVASQLVRPFMFVFHIIRRNVRRPYWRSLGDG